MAALMVQYRVRDYDAWRKAFDANEPARAEATLRNCRIYRNAEDANDVVLLFEAADMEKARAFGASAKLKEVQKQGGVIGEPIVLRG